MVHIAALPLSGLGVGAMRWFNLSLVIVGCGAIWFSLNRLSFEQPFARTAMILSVPMIWVMAGMALTEGPAFMMAALALASAIWAYQQRNHWQIYVGFFAAGMFA